MSLPPTNGSIRPLAHASRPGPRVTIPIYDKEGQFLRRVKPRNAYTPALCVAIA